MAWGVTDQADPRAIEILSRNGADLKAPVLDDHFWAKLTRDYPNLAKELVELCILDFPTFCAVMFKIVPKGGVASPFLFNRPQRLVWDQMLRLLEQKRPMFLVVLKARQLGMSSFFAAWMFWWIWRKGQVSGLVVTHKMNLAEHIVGMMRVAYDNLPNLKPIRPDLRKTHVGATVPRGEVFFSDRNSGLVLHVAKELDPRGMSASVILESEKAFYERAEQLDASLLPQLPSLGTEARANCSFIVESTPNGQNHFYQEYKSSEPTCEAQFTWKNRRRIKSERISIFLPWIVHDEVQFGGYAIPVNQWFKLTDDEKKERARLSKIRRHYDGNEVTVEQMHWRRVTLEDDYHGDIDRFNMEYPSDDISCFLMMSDSAFRHVMPYLRRCVDSADERAQKAWEKQRGHKTDGPVIGKMTYDLPMTSDGSETKGRLENIRFIESKNGPLTVWEPPKDNERYVAALDPGHGIEGGDWSAIKILSVRGCREVASFKDILNPLDAIDMLCAIGAWYNNALINCEINQYQWTVITRAVERNYSNPYHWQKWDEPNKKTPKLFWETTTKSRSMLFLNLLRWLENQYCAISSPELLAELSGFEKSLESDDEGIRVHFDQQKGMHDDETMAYALALMTIKQSPVYTDFTPFELPPSAAELGLQGQKEKDQAVAITRMVESESKARELIEKVSGAYEMPVPWNPIRGPEEAIW